MPPRPPAARGFTLAEHRSLKRERTQTNIIIAVALVAAVVSFFALAWVGSHMGMEHGVQYLVPLAVDGFGIACSLGIARSVDAGEDWRGRGSEWVGLLGALTVSMAGNIEHGLHMGDAMLPDWFKIAYSAAMPVIVAWGIHVWSKAASKGISAHVLADDPDQLVFGLARIGEEVATATARPARPAGAAAPAPLRSEARPGRHAHGAQAGGKPPARGSLDAEVFGSGERDDARSARVSATPSPRAAREETDPAARADAQPAARTGATSSGHRDRIIAAAMAAIAAEPGVKPDAKRIHDALGLTTHPATTRGLVKRVWDEHLAAEEAAADAPVAVNLADAVGQDADRALSLR